MTSLPCVPDTSSVPPHPALPWLKLGSFQTAPLPPISPVEILAPEVHLRYSCCGETFLSVSPTQNASPSPRKYHSLSPFLSLETSLGLVLAVFLVVPVAQRRALSSVSQAHHPPCKATSNRHMMPHRLHLPCPPQSRQPPRCC